MASYQKMVTEDLRRLLLTLLAKDSDYAINDNILQSALATYSHSVSKDDLCTQLDWLETNRLIDVEHVFDIRIAKLTDKGLEVANGQAYVEGVRRAKPSELI